jgi:hypothetical protein
VVENDGANGFEFVGYFADGDTAGGSGTGTESFVERRGE